jgi:CheY-like chemotaxis protein
MVVKVLVIEDEQPLLEEVMDMLRFEGFEALGAPNGLEGVRLAQQHLPDLILCDIVMPAMDGYGVLFELRNDPALATTPFIFLTARVRRPEQRTGMAMGADDYLTKPFTHDELLATIHAQIEKQQARLRLTEQRLQQLGEKILAAMPHEMRTPLVGIFGPTDPQRNGPWGEDDLTVSRYRSCDCHYQRRCHIPGWCLLDIAPREVMDLVERRLARHA